MELFSSYPTLFYLTKYNLITHFFGNELIQKFGICEIIAKISWLASLLNTRGDFNDNDNWYEIEVKLIFCVLLIQSDQCIKVTQISKHMAKA